MNSLAFDLSSCAVASISCYWQLPQAHILKNPLLGLQAFAITAIFTRAVKGAMSIKHYKRMPASLFETLSYPLIENIVYVSVFLTKSIQEIVLRFFAVSHFGEFAGQSLTGRITVRGRPFDIDVKIGIIWAIYRECILFSIPQITTLLMVSDAFLFALGDEEVSPVNQWDLPRFSLKWSARVLSLAVCRTVQNALASRYGIVAAIVYRYLFNISRIL